MREVGDIGRFGFRLGDSSDCGQVRDVAIFINGVNVTIDTSAYLPSFLGGLQGESHKLKETLNFEKYADIFRSYNLTETHNILLHGDRLIFNSDDDWGDARSFHSFMNLGEPNTDSFTAFLIVSIYGMYITYQLVNQENWKYQRVDAVDGIGRVTPYELIKTIEEAIAVLKAGM